MTRLFADERVGPEQIQPDERVWISEANDVICSLKGILLWAQLCAAALRFSPVTKVLALPPRWWRISGWTRLRLRPRVNGMDRRPRRPVPARHCVKSSCWMHPVGSFITQTTPLGTNQSARRYLTSHRLQSMTSGETVRSFSRLPAAKTGWPATRRLNRLMFFPRWPQLFAGSTRSAARGMDPDWLRS